MNSGGVIRLLLAAGLASTTIAAALTTLALVCGMPLGPAAEPTRVTEPTAVTEPTGGDTVASDARAAVDASDEISRAVRQVLERVAGLDRSSAELREALGNAAGERPPPSGDRGVSVGGQRAPRESVSTPLGALEGVAARLARDEPLAAVDLAWRALASHLPPESAGRLGSAWVDAYAMMLVIERDHGGALSHSHRWQYLLERARTYCAQERAWSTFESALLSSAQGDGEALRGRIAELDLFVAQHPIDITRGRAIIAIDGLRGRLAARGATLPSETKNR